MNNKYGVSYLTITGLIHYNHIDCLPMLLHSLYYANLDRSTGICEIELPNAAARLVLSHVKLWFDCNFKNIITSLNDSYTNLAVVRENFGLTFEVVEL